MPPLRQDRPSDTGPCRERDVGRRAGWTVPLAGRSPRSVRITRRSVTMAVISDAGVTSKAGLSVRVPAGAVRTPRKVVTSSASRSSISIPSPSGVAESTVVSGATTRNGTPAWRAARARARLPTLLAVSPLAVILSAPMSTTSARPRARTDAAAPSTSNRNGAPMRASSQAVRRAPWSSGRVSSGSASSSRPRACTSPITPSAVPRSTAASAPVLQMVMIRIRGRATSSRTRSAPRTAMAPQAAMSSSRIASASARTAARALRQPGQRPVRAPGQVDRRGSRSAQPGGTLTDRHLVARIARRQKRHAHGPSDTQRRSATDREPEDGVDEVVESRDPQNHELVGEAGLVDEADLALDPVDGPVTHGGHCTGRRTRLAPRWLPPTVRYAPSSVATRRPPWLRAAHRRYGPVSERRKAQGGGRVRPRSLQRTGRGVGRYRAACPGTEPLRRLKAPDPRLTRRRPRPASSNASFGPRSGVTSAVGWPAVPPQEWSQLHPSPSPATATRARVLNR